MRSRSKATPSVIDARGPAEYRVTELWWLMLVLSAVVFLLVVAMIGGGLVRSRRRTDMQARADAPWGERFIVIVGVVVSAVVLTTVFALSIRVLGNNTTKSWRD